MFSQLDEEISIALYLRCNTEIANFLRNFLRFTFWETENNN